VRLAKIFNVHTVLNRITSSKGPKHVGLPHRQPVPRSARRALDAMADDLLDRPEKRPAVVPRKRPSQAFGSEQLSIEGRKRADSSGRVGLDIVRVVAMNTPIVKVCFPRATKFLGYSGFLTSFLCFICLKDARLGLRHAPWWSWAQPHPYRGLQTQLARIIKMHRGASVSRSTRGANFATSPGSQDYSTVPGYPWPLPLFTRPATR
jgi:hypothetical protein